MNISRIESMAAISQKVEKIEIEKIILHEFSNYTLEMLAKSDRELIDRIAHTKLSSEGVERLFKAYDTNIITMGDLMHIANYSLVTGGSEKYFNDYFSSIAAGLDTKTASRILVASKFEDWSYNEIYSLVKSGTYTVGDNTFVALNPDVAREIDKLGIDLYAYDKSNDFYLDKTIADGDAITFSKCSLAVRINEMRNYPDWNAFRDYIAEDMDDINSLKVKEIYDRSNSNLSNRQNSVPYQRNNDTPDHLARDVENFMYGRQQCGRCTSDSRSKCYPHKA